MFFFNGILGHFLCAKLSVWKFGCAKQFAFGRSGPTRWTYGSRIGELAVDIVYRYIRFKHETSIPFIACEYFHLARPLGQANSWYCCVCLCLCVSVYLSVPPHAIQKSPITQKLTHSSKLTQNSKVTHNSKSQP